MSFYENLRRSLDDYNGSTDKTEQLRKEIRDNREGRKFTSALGKTLVGIGTAGAASTWSGGPATGIPGTILGGGLAVLGGYADLHDKKARQAEDKILQDKLRQEHTNNWSKYKNDSIAKETGKTVGDWAREGKMFDDDGNLMDIDYDFYKDIDLQTLRRVFDDGAEDVYWRANGR